jgi:hypothetical protein
MADNTNDPGMCHNQQLPDDTSTNVITTHRDASRKASERTNPCEVEALNRRRLRWTVQMCVRVNAIPTDAKVHYTTHRDASRKTSGRMNPCEDDALNRRGLRWTIQMCV